MQLALGFSTNGAEELQKKTPDAHVVKAFNTVFAQHMEAMFWGNNSRSLRPATISRAPEVRFSSLARLAGSTRWMQSLSPMHASLRHRDILFKGEDSDYSTPEIAVTRPVR
jgi:hypothetical protein